MRVYTPKTIWEVQVAESARQLKEMEAMRKKMMDDLEKVRMQLWMQLTQLTQLTPTDSTDTTDTN